MVNPKSILVISQKGGVGKTTVADEIAYSLDRTSTPYAFYDLDGQGNAAHAGHVEEDPAVAIVDTPGRLDDAVVDSIVAADVVVVPTRATADDMRTVVTTLRIVRNDSDAPIVLVVNCMNRYSMAQQFSQWLEDASTDGKLPANMRILYVSQAEAVPQARGMRKSIVEYKRSSSSTTEILAVVNTVRRAIDLPDETLPDSRTRQAPSTNKTAVEQRAKMGGFTDRMAADRAARLAGQVKEPSDNGDGR